MNPDWQRLERRLAEYESAVEVLLREYHDEQTLTHFSDRFGAGHPLSQRADLGVHLQQRLRSLRLRVQVFVREALREFPAPELK